MAISLTPETERILEARAKRDGYATPDDLIRVALGVLDHVDDDCLSQEELAELSQSLAEVDRGEVVEWSDLSARLRHKFLGES